LSLVRGNKWWVSDSENLIAGDPMDLNEGFDSILQNRIGLRDEDYPHL